MPDAASSPEALHAATITGNVIRAAVRDAGATGVVVLDAESPEGRLARTWLARTLGDDAVVPAPAPAHATTGPIDTDEYRRAAGRIHAREYGLVLAHPACKTVLLLASDVPPERILPLGDVYATEMADWAGGVSLPDDVRALADMAGGLSKLDRALHAWLERRRPLEAALSELPGEARAAVSRRLLLNRAVRRWPRCVPKIGRRTLWIDVFA
jgi:hypothetical protein